MRLEAALLVSLLSCVSTACSARTQPEAPTLCFQVRFTAEGEKELLSALSGLAESRGLIKETSSPSYVGYLDQDHHYRMMYMPELEGRGTVVAYRGQTADGAGLPELLSKLSADSGFKYNVCPPKSADYSPPTLYE
jgi:hypothetical protein